MVKGIWRGLTNCEICIYDRNCGVTCCRRHRPDSCSESQTSVGNTSQEILNAASKYHHFESFLTDKDIICGPDPTLSVSIVQVPEAPRFAQHFEDDDDESL